MSKPRFHVAIVGAGLGGLAAAIGISRAGHEVTILEKASALGEVGAGIQIPPNSSRILKQWDILSQIESVSVRPSDFILRSYHDGTVLSKQNMVPFALDNYGVPYLHIHRADYHRILVDEAVRVGVKIILDSAAIGIDFQKPSVQVAKKPDFHADLIIGADGVKSTCREILLGRSDPPHMTGDLAYRILVKAEDMRSHPSLRDLVEKPAVNYWLGPHAHVVCYLLKEGGLYNIVLICPDNLPEMVNTAKADLQEMRDFFQQWDPRLKLLLSMVQETDKWRLQNSREMKSWSHPSGKFTLLGDACHATLPYLAQGAAQALEDGAVLGQLFAQIESKAQTADIFMIYEQIRKQRTTRVVQGSTALRDIFHMEDGDQQRNRDHQMAQLKPVQGHPNRWADPELQKWLFGYDAVAEARAAWSLYQKGRFFGNTREFRANL